MRTNNWKLKKLENLFIVGGFRIFVMSFIIFFSGFLTAQSNPNDILVNYSGKQKALKDVIVSLSKKTNINISFSDDLIPIDSLVDFSFKKKSVIHILSILLANTKVEVKTLETDIVLVKKKLSKLSNNVHGYISDINSGEKLTNVIIHFSELNISTVSNDYGYYNVLVPSGKHKVEIRYLAYNVIIDELVIEADIEHNVKLKPLALLNEILIENKYDPEIYTSNQGAEIPLKMSHSFISIGGETNVMKYIGSTSGVSSSADQISGISVRGGNTSQNLVLMDGVPVYNADHVLGLFSIFNNDILKSVTFYKGAFPSRYHGNLSSVTDVKIKEGNNKSLGGSISLGTFSAKAFIEGPIIKNKSSFLFSMRRTTVDPWIRSIIDLSNTSDGKSNTIGNYYLYDINFKFNYKLNKKNHLYVSSYIGRDKLSFHKRKEQRIIIDSTFISNDDYLIQYTNQLYSLRLNTHWGNSLFSNLTLYSTNYLLRAFQSKHFLIKDDVKNREWYNARLFKSNLKEIGLKINFDYTGITNHIMKFGVHFTNTNNSPGLIVINQNNDIIPANRIPTTSLLEDSFNPYEQSSINISTFYEDEFLLSKNIYLNIGINVNAFKYDSKLNTSIDPRLSLLYKSPDGFNIVWGLSRMSQFNHLLSNNGLGIPFNIWLPTADKMKLEKAWISSFGIGYLWKDRLKFDLSIYYKKMQNIYSFKEGSLIPVTSVSNWSDLLVSGEAESYGLEFSTIKNIGKTVFALNYTYSYVFNQYDGINLGKRYHGNFDRRHMINLALTQRINNNMEFSATWKLSSGSPVTIGSIPYITTNSEGTPYITFYIDKLNNKKLPTYHRLDLGFNIYSTYSWGKQKISIGIINAYNQKNPYYLDVNVDGIENISYKQYYLIPILPSITYSLSFK